MIKDQARPFPLKENYKLKQGIRKLAKFKVNTGKTLGKLPFTTKIPLQGNGMAAIPKLWFVVL